MSVGKPPAPQFGSLEHKHSTLGRVILAFGKFTLFLISAREVIPMHEAHTSLTLSCQIANARTHFPHRKNSLAVLSRLVNPCFGVRPSRQFRLPFGAGNEYRTRFPVCKSSGNSDADHRPASEEHPRVKAPATHDVSSIPVRRRRKESSTKMGERRESTSSRCAARPFREHPRVKAPATQDALRFPSDEALIAGGRVSDGNRTRDLQDHNLAL